MTVPGRVSPETVESAESIAMDAGRGAFAQASSGETPREVIVGEEKKADAAALSMGKAGLAKGESVAGADLTHELEKPAVYKQIEKMEKMLTREIWVVKYALDKARTAYFFLSLLIAAIPVVSTAVVALDLHMAHLAKEVGDSSPDLQRTTWIASLFSVLHVMAITAQTTLKLETRISQLEMVLRTSTAVLRTVQMAEFKPAAVLPNLLADLEKQLQGGKGGVVHEPHDWMFKLYDSQMKAGKISEKI
jgi:hypothetical protein